MFTKTGRIWKRFAYLLLLIILITIWFAINTWHIIPIGEISDYNRLINLTSFMFTILNRSNSTPFLLVLVHTGANHFDRRKCIRETWGVKRNRVDTFFMLGSVATEKEQLDIEEENAKYKDIIQGAFLDSYRNLSYKHAMTLKYATYYYSQVRYVLKLDDDVFVNVPTILDFLTNDYSTYGAKRRLLCLPAGNLWVVRSPSKWQTSFREYNETDYPPYCLGFSTIYSLDVVHDLYRTVQKSKFFWLDDVLVTGIAREKTNIIITSIKSLILSRNAVDEIISQKIQNPNIPAFIFSTFELTVEDMYKFSETVNNVTIK